MKRANGCSGGEGCSSKAPRDSRRNGVTAERPQNGKEPEGKECVPGIPLIPKFLPGAVLMEHKGGSQLQNNCKSDTVKHDG